MFTSATKSVHNSSPSMGDRLSETGKNTSRLPVADNRPEALVMLRLQEAANNSPQVNRMKQLQTMAGETGTVQLKTAINHDTATFDAESRGMGNFPVGVGVQAELDPAYPVIGSATSRDTTSKLGSICSLFDPKLEQTHLLNADLGGFGVYENLYPMTPKANRDHFNKVERHVKGALHKATKNYFGKEQVPESEGTGVYYNVSVEGTHSFSGLRDGTVFNCEAYFIDDVKKNPVPNKRKKIVEDRVTSLPLSDGAPDKFQGNNVVLKWWDHKQGSVNPHASESQKKFINKREGKADLANRFSMYTPDKTWDDYRKNAISVDSDLFNDKLDSLQSIVFKNYETAKLLGMERFNNDIYTNRLDAILSKIKRTPRHVILNSFDHVKTCVVNDEKETFDKILEDDKLFWESIEELEVLEEDDEDEDGNDNEEEEEDEDVPDEEIEEVN